METNNIKTFEDLEFKPHPNLTGNKQARITFDNGYGANIVKHLFSYEGKDGLYLLTVLNNDGEICSIPPISMTFNSGSVYEIEHHDIIKWMEDGGMLNGDGISELMIKIQELPTRENTNTDNNTTLTK
jgi:hypothetical protein